MEERPRFITGRQSKLAKNLEQVIMSGKEVEVELENREVINGKIRNYEFTANHLFLTIETENNIRIVNFAKAIELRIGKN